MIRQVLTAAAAAGAGAATISIFALAFNSSKCFFRFCPCSCCINVSLTCSSGGTLFGPDIFQQYYVIAELRLDCLFTEFAFRQRGDRRTEFRNHALRIEPA